MEVQNQLRTWSPTSLQTYTSKSCRALTIEEVWESNEPSFAMIRKESGPELTKSLLFIEIGKMVQLLKADMQEIHIEYFADYILKHYWAYTISDLTALTNKLVNNNPYGKPILQNIIHELDKYSYERDEYAVNQRQKEASEQKNNMGVDVEILKIYDKLKAEGREQKENEKEKKERISKEQEQRRLEFERLYPKEQYQGFLDAVLNDKLIKE